MNSIVTELPLEWGRLNLPLEVDMGSHKGTFLVAMAEMYPDRKFLGIERQSGRIDGCLKKIARLGLSNAHAMRGEGITLLRELELQARVIHVSFPDPWPKRRHQTRRLVKETFFIEAWKALECGGQLRLMTDNESYFRAMERSVSVMDGFEAIDWEDGREYPLTEFQMKFKSKPIYRLALRRCDSMSSL